MRATRRGFALGAIAMLPLAAAAQAPTRRYRLRYLTGGQISSRQYMLDGLLDGLAQLGYRRDTNLDFEARGADGDLERLPALAAEAVRQAPDVLIASTTPGVRAAIGATTRIPIVMLAPGDPLRLGFVRSLSRPEANVTGISNATVELTGKRLELLSELVPQARRIAALINPEDPNAPFQLGNARDAAEKQKIELAPVLEIRSLADVEPAVAAAVAAGAHAAIRMVDPLTTIIRPALQQAAARHRLPMIYLFREDVEAGGLIAYGANQVQLYRQGARLVHRLLQGATPAELPVELPNTYELTINQRAARALGIEVPAVLLARADEVFE